MIEVFPFAGMPVAVLGLGKSGLATAKALAASEAEVRAWDDNEDRRAAARAAGIEPVDLLRADFGDLTSLILSPGIPHTHPAPHPVVAKARKAGLEIVCDVDLLFRCQRESAYVGVTGTNGKSTTTALIGHIFAAAGRPAAVGGNIGTAVLDLEPLAAGGTYVIEMSSYQLELAPTAVWDVAVLLNVSPDHLDRHGGMDGYVAAKRTIFQRQTRPRVAIVGVDDPIAAAIRDDLVRADDQIVVAVSGGRRLDRGVYVADGTLYDARDGKPVAIRDMADCKTLPGAHNHQNAAAAAAVALQTGIAPAILAQALASYPGLPHRQETVAEIGGVRFVNDSKATNADAAARALGCYARVRWIAGGKAKEGGIDGLRAFFPRIAHAYLIGEAANDFARSLGDVPHTLAGDLESAVRLAAKDAQAGDVVLLSPACASFDQFRSFEHRGETFRELVGRLAA